MKSRSRSSSSSSNGDEEPESDSWDVDELKNDRREKLLVNSDRQTSDEQIKELLLPWKAEVNPSLLTKKKVNK